MSTITRISKCKCGKCQIRLSGEPLGNWNCHCHSCTAASRFITEKHPEGTTQLSDITNNTGSAMSVYNLKDTIFVDGSPQDDNFGYIKVGENGKVVRSYTKCCGTQAFTSGMPIPLSYRHFNRNCIYNEDGTKYIPKDPVPNLMLSYAFVDPSVVSETPKYNYIPLSLLGVVVPNMIKTMLGLADMGKMADEPSMFFKSEDVDEIVPINWE